MLCWRDLTNFGFVIDMKINKVQFARDYEFELPYEVEVPDDLFENFEPNRLLLFILYKLICENSNELLKRLTPDDSSV